MYDGVYILYKNELLCEKNFRCILSLFTFTVLFSAFEPTNDCLKLFIKVLDTFIEANILNQKSFIFAKLHFEMLENHIDQLKQKYDSTIFAVQPDNVILTAICHECCQEAHILTTDNIQKITVNTCYTKDLQCSVWLLYHAESLTQPNFDMITKHIYDITNIKKILLRLENANILTTDNCNIFIANIRYLWEFANSFDLLSKANILNQDNFKAIIKNVEHAISIVASLKKLYVARNLNQKNFEILINEIEGNNVEPNERIIAQYNH
jgi:hypothetical protein